MRSRLGSWVLLAALAAGNSLVASVTNAPPVFRQIYALDHNGRVTIQNVYGNVSITAWDQDAVLVEAIKHSPGADARVVVDSTADSISIATQYGSMDADHPSSVEYHLTVPRGIRIENVAVTNGQLSLDGLSGTVKASSVNGDIHALKLAGQVELSTVNGRVDAAFDSTSRANPISLSSINGAIRLTIPVGAGANVEAQNLSGGILSDLGHAFRTAGGHRLIVKGSGPLIRLHNVNGGISIHSERSNT